MRHGPLTAAVLAVAVAVPVLVMHVAGADAASSSVSSSLGFDTGTAPSTTVMDAWKADPKSEYSAVGVYLPVSRYDDRHDKKQTNLTTSWLQHQRDNGWSIIPIYLGLQAPAPCGNSAFWRMALDPGVAYSQGQQAATDAAAQVAKLGLPAGSPVYYDMEAYAGGCSRSVQAYFQGWSTTLRSKGDVPGVYGSRASTMTDLVGRLSANACVEPDAVWPATGNGSHSTYGISPLPDSAWKGARINQTKLGHSVSYGGHSLSIDTDIVAGPVVPASGAASATVSPGVATACVPGPPVRLTVKRGSKTIRLNWQAADAAGSPVTGYTIATSVGSKPSGTVTVGATARTRKVSKLINGRTYTFAVTATNKLGRSVSNHVTVTPAGKPLKPAKPKLTGKKRALTIHWTVKGDNGAKITKIRVHIRGKVRTYSRRRSVTVKGLKKGTYKIAIQFVNAVGASKRSTIASARVR